jgi:hypothetical protein
MTDHFFLLCLAASLDHDLLDVCNYRYQSLEQCMNVGRYALLHNSFHPENPALEVRCIGTVRGAQDCDSPTWECFEETGKCVLISCPL